MGTKEHAERDIKAEEKGKEGIWHTPEVAVAPHTVVFA